MNRRYLLPLILGLGVAAAVTLLAAQHVTPVAGIALPMLIGAGALFVKPGQPIEKRLALIMLMGALVLSLVVEVVVLEGDLGRMNTVFKFYIQIWLLLAVVAGASFGWLWGTVKRATQALRVPWLATLGMLVFLAALYPLMATRAKVADRWNPDAPHTLDGMAYMPYVTRYENGVAFSLLPDYEMLRWLQDNITGTPVVLEGLSAYEYLWGNRVSVYTGLPSVVGWRYHQTQQRPWEANAVNQRRTDVAEAYNTPSVDRAMQLIEQYHVDLIVVGNLERAYYDPAGLAKFDTMTAQGLLRVIYTQNNTTVYQVVRGQAATP